MSTTATQKQPAPKLPFTGSEYIESLRDGETHSVQPEPIDQRLVRPVRTGRSVREV
jgi:hypothetical protein